MMHCALWIVSRELSARRLRHGDGATEKVGAKGTPLFRRLRRKDHIAVDAGCINL
jgi:hypothetical protein